MQHQASAATLWPLSPAFFPSCRIHARTASLIILDRQLGEGPSAHSTVTCTGTHDIICAYAGALVRLHAALHTPTSHFHTSVPAWNGAVS